MKKIYFAPETKTVKIQTQHIIAASLNGLGDEGDTTTLTDESAEGGTDGWARRGGFWDDED